MHSGPDFQCNDLYWELFSALGRIITDNKEEESEEMLAPGSGLACRCLCDTKEKYFIHLTGGVHRLAEEAKENWKQGETGYSTKLRLNISI